MVRMDYTTSRTIFILSILFFALPIVVILTCNPPLLGGQTATTAEGAAVTEATVFVMEEEKGKRTGTQGVQATVTVKEEEEVEPPDPQILPEGLPCESATALIERGLLDMEVTGTGTTTSLVFNMANLTDRYLCVILPSGTQVTTTSEGYQPYQAGRIPPIILEPGETLSKAVRVDGFHAADDRRRDYRIMPASFSESPAPPKPVREPLTSPGSAATLVGEFPAWCTDESLEPAPLETSVKYTPQAGPITEQQEKITELIVVADTLQELHTTCGGVAEPDDLTGMTDIKSTAYTPADWPSKDTILLNWLQLWNDDVWRFVVPGDLEFDLTGPLVIPGTIKFVKPEVDELKANISSKDENGKVVLFKPTGELEVALAPTEDQEVVEFNIIKLKAYTNSYEVLGESMEDIIVTLNSPEESTGTLNMMTGEVNGTLSVKAFGEKYDDPFPAAATYTGRFDIPTKKLRLKVKGTGFEPIKLEHGFYQRRKPGKFWEAVHLYAIWGETNDIGKKELREVMATQLMTKFPKERAKKIADVMAKEVIDKVDEVDDLQEELKDEGFDFSKLDPSLKWRGKT
ncbi:MAG: hypothetical protein ACYSRP_06090 [Planctomycetota bacterium]|jgi:hypothetical protein